MTLDEALQYTNPTNEYVREALEVLRAEIHRLQTRTEDWPESATNTQVYQGMELWHPKWGHGKVRMVVRGECWFTEYDHKKPMASSVQVCYESPEEAEKHQ